jgi:methionyl-tRNA formyltransferase
MRLVFMGTPDFAVVTLQALVDAGHDILCVYAQPPRAAGRGLKLRPSPVQVFAESKGITVRTPLSLKSKEAQDEFAALDADAAVVVAYGLLLSNAVLDAPKFGCFNVHASLLPRWRGAAPLQRAIMAGDAETGVTIMRMDEGLDTGPMMKIVRTPITSDMTIAELHDVLARIGSAAMVDVLQKPDAAGVPQPAEGVTYARKIEKAEARIDFTRPATEVRNHIHGLSPFPGAWFEIAGARVKVLKCEMCDGSGEAGVALDQNLRFACGSGAVRFLVLQREGKAAMDAQVFSRGFAIAAGDKVS